jgi:hypothetical protein
MSNEQWKKNPANIKKDDVGKFVFVKLCNGTVEGILVKFGKKNNLNHKVFILYNRKMYMVNSSQIVAKFDFVRSNLIYQA